MRRHLVWTLIGLICMAAIGIVTTFFVGKKDLTTSGEYTKGETSLSSFVSSIIDRINN